MTNLDVDLAVIGGGAAGFFAAIHCAANAKGARIVICEKSNRLLSKIAISGGGRCNVTHACFEPHELIKHYPRGGRELRGPFNVWQPRDTVEWFESAAVPIKVEADGRMFPVSDKSQSIIDALTSAAQQAGIHIQRQLDLSDLQRQADGSFTLHFKQGAPVNARAVVIAVGAIKPGRLTACLEQMGHPVTPLAPSLFTFNVQGHFLSGLAGLSVPNAQVSLPGEKLQQSGPLLVTHWGLSGPAILKLSAWGARRLQALDYRFAVRINWSGGKYNEETAYQELTKIKQERSRQQVARHGAMDIPKRLWERLTAAAGIAGADTWAGLPKQSLRRLSQELTATELAVNGKSTYKDEFVTCGGIDLKGVDFKTMESKTIPGLYFAGECLDIDGVTGGFNFQAAWTTGYIAGTAASRAACQTRP